LYLTFPIGCRDADIAGGGIYWPARFSPEKRYRWTDLARNWVIPKPMFGRLMPGVFPPMLLNTKTPPVVVEGILVLIAAVVTSALLEESGKKKRDCEGGD
jgi:hypothetical protein